MFNVGPRARTGPGARRTHILSLSFTHHTHTPPLPPLSHHPPSFPPRPAALPRKESSDDQLASSAAVAPGHRVCRGVLPVATMGRMRIGATIGTIGCLQSAGGGGRGVGGRG